jgi:hypothetical protein
VSKQINVEVASNQLQAGCAGSERAEMKQQVWRHQLHMNNSKAIAFRLVTFAELTYSLSFVLLL